MAAAMFSSRCATDEVPAIGSITGERRSSQASATCPGGRSVPLGDLVHRPAGPGELAGRERSPGEEGNAELLAALEHVIRAAIGDVEAVLHGDDLGDPASRLELIDRGVRDPDVEDLALVLKLLQGPDRLLVGDLRVGPVELVELDPLQPQAAQRALARLAQALRAPIGRPPARPVRVSPPLVAIRRSSGYGWSASAISSSLTSGPYESAVSIRLTPSSTARRRTAIASS